MILQIYSMDFITPYIQKLISASNKWFTGAKRSTRVNTSEFGVYLCKQQGNGEYFSELLIVILVIFFYMRRYVDIYLTGY